MKQTSTQFFDEMLKDNMQEQPAGDFQEQLANMIDKRIEASMKKFEEQFSQIPQQPAADPAEAAQESAAAQGLPEDQEPTESGLLTED